MSLVSTAGASAMEELTATVERGLVEGWSKPLLVHIPRKSNEYIVYLLPIVLKASGFAFCMVD